MFDIPGTSAHELFQTFSLGYRIIESMTLDQKQPPQKHGNGLPFSKKSTFNISLVEVLGNTIHSLNLLFFSLGRSPSLKWLPRFEPVFD